MADCLDNFPEGDTFLDEHFEFMVPYDEGTINIFTYLFFSPKHFFKLYATSLLPYLVVI